MDGNLCKKEHWGVSTGNMDKSQFVYINSS